MKIAVIVPPAYRPFMPSFFAGAVAEKIRELGHIVDVKDVNKSFFDYIYNDNLTIEYDNGEKCVNTSFYNKNIVTKFKTTCNGEELSKKEFDALQDEIELRNRILEKHISCLKFGFFDIRYDIQESGENSNGLIIEILNKTVRIEDYDGIAIVVESNNQWYFSSIILEMFKDLKNKTILVIVPQYGVVKHSPLVDNKYYITLTWEDNIKTLLKDILKGNENRDDLYYHINKGSPEIDNFFDFNIDDFSNNDYYYPVKKYPVATSLGCSYGKCVFCPYSIGKRSFVLKKEKVFLQLANAFNKGYSFIEFIDPNIHINYLLEIANYLIKNDLKVNWIANTRLYEQLLYDKNCELLQRSGCKKLFIGLESYDQKLLNDMNKGILITNIVKVLENLKKHSISTHTSFLFGFPGETQEQATRTELFIKDNINLMDVVEINRYVDVLGSNEITKEYDVEKVVMRLREYVDNHNKAPSYYNIYRLIIE